MNGNQNAAPSANSTVLPVASNNVITDPAGNTWTITINHQVAVNGLVDPTTNSVIELVYAGQQIWREDANSLWWTKSGPATPWVPGAGTSTSQPSAPVTNSIEIVSQAQLSALARPGHQIRFLHDACPLTEPDCGTETWGTKICGNAALAVSNHLDREDALPPNPCLCFCASSDDNRVTASGLQALLPISSRLDKVRFDTGLGRHNSDWSTDHTMA